MNRLFANNPAGTSNAIDMAICTVASVVRKRRAALAPPGWPAWFFSVDGEIGARAVQRREQAERDAGDERRTAGEHQHRRAQRERDQRRRRRRA